VQALSAMQQQARVASKPHKLRSHVLASRTVDVDVILSENAPPAAPQRRMLAPLPSSPALLPGVGSRLTCRPATALGLSSSFVGGSGADDDDDAPPVSSSGAAAASDSVRRLRFPSFVCTSRTCCPLSARLAALYRLILCV
jgi:hypothetical protein